MKHALTGRLTIVAILGIAAACFALTAAMTADNGQQVHSEQA